MKIQSVKAIQSLLFHQLAGVNMYVVQVVGYKNSGKTTLVNHWIEFLTNRNYQVATIKHHGHGGEPSYDKNTDSHQHFNHGSHLSTVIGEQTFSMIGKSKSFSFLSTLALYEQSGIDVVLIEGYKHLPIPKVVLIRDEKDEPLIESLEEIKYFFTKRGKENISFPVTGFHEYNQLFEAVEMAWEVFSYHHIKKRLIPN